VHFYIVGYFKGTFYYAIEILGILMIYNTIKTNRYINYKKSFANSTYLIIINIKYIFLKNKEYL